MGNCITATKRYTFEASHSLVDYNGKCSHLHGHSYKLEVSFSRATGLNSQGMVIDFNTIDKIVEPILERYDHTHLNLILPNPTAEVLAQVLYEEIADILKNMCRVDDNLNTVHVTQLKLWETEKCYVTIG